jgi:hypothetical protein
MTKLKYHGPVTPFETSPAEGDKVAVNVMLKPGRIYTGFDEKHPRVVTMIGSGPLKPPAKDDKAQVVPLVPADKPQTKPLAKTAK